MDKNKETLPTKDLNYLQLRYSKKFYRSPKNWCKLQFQVRERTFSAGIPSDIFLLRLNELANDYS